MKKHIFMLAAVGVAACCLGACTTEPAVNEYDVLNDMLNKSYSQIVLTVTDTFDENTWLTSEYIMEYSDSGVTVNYSVEKFDKIDASLDGPLENVKTILTGEVVIENGIVISDNDDVNITADIAEIGLNFNGDYFDNAQLEDMSLKADVKNVSAFLGSQLTCTDMKVQATFLMVFYNIKITYTSESGSKVEYNYAFTR